MSIVDMMIGVTMNEEFCKMCDKEMLFVESDGTRQAYCSDKCRVDYHNAKRKIDRAADRANAAIDLIYESSHDKTHIAHYALKQLSKIMQRMDEMQHGINFVCNECGQSRFTTPTGACDYCGQNSWRPVNTIT